MDDLERAEAKLKQVDAAVRRAARFSAALPDKTFTGRSPDRTVTATVDGTGRLTGVEIEPHALARSDPRELSAAIVAAVESANSRIENYRAEKLADRGVAEIHELNEFVATMVRG